MIIATADLQSGHLMLPRDTANESPNAGFQLWFDPIDAVLSAENDVIVQRCVCVCHCGSPPCAGDFIRRYATMASCYPSVPALKGRPKIIRHCVPKKQFQSLLKILSSPPATASTHTARFPHGGSNRSRLVCRFAGQAEFDLFDHRRDGWLALHPDVAVLQHFPSQ